MNNINPKIILIILIILIGIFYIKLVFIPSFNEIKTPQGKYDIKKLDYKNILPLSVSFQVEYNKQMTYYCYLIIAGTIFLMLKFESEDNYWILGFYATSLCVIFFAVKSIVMFMDHMYLYSYQLVYYLGEVYPSSSFSREGMDSFYRSANLAFFNLVLFFIFKWIKEQV